MRTSHQPVIPLLAQAHTRLRLFFRLQPLPYSLSDYLIQPSLATGPNPLIPQGESIMKSYPSLAIIGTAGRKGKPGEKDDSKIVTGATYPKMVNAGKVLVSRITRTPLELKGYSGGAAFGDHTLVTLALDGILSPRNITLYLPADLSENGTFVHPHDPQDFTVRTANYYHDLFSKKIGRNTREELVRLRDMGATFIVNLAGFKARNTQVAHAVSPDGVMLALTTGNDLTDQRPWTLRRFVDHCRGRDAGLKDGGTEDTWNKACCAKFHGLIA